MFSSQGRVMPLPNYGIFVPVELHKPLLAMNPTSTPFRMRYVHDFYFRTC